MTFLVGDSLLAPPPGSTSVGDLYVDLQSRTMWMGVDLAVDPVGAVLVSDILSIQPAIDAMGVINKQYTDTKLLSYSLIGHHHVAADIDDFDDAVLDVIGGGGSSGGFFPGFVAMYSGAMANIGVGPLANWALCDGSNGTPDLRDRFVLGAGNRAPGIANTLTVATSSVVAAHKHTVLGHTLTIAEMPIHQHAVSASGSGSGSTNASGNHQHSFYTYTGGTDTGGHTKGEGSGVNGTGYTDAGGNHAHSVSVSVTVSGTTDNRGGGASHDHDMDLANAHSHTLSQSNLRETMPYLTLAFIMKL